MLCNKELYDFMNFSWEISGKSEKVRNQWYGSVLCPVTSFSICDIEPCGSITTNVFL